MLYALINLKPITNVATCYCCYWRLRVCSITGDMSRVVTTISRDARAQSM